MLKYSILIVSSLTLIHCGSWKSRRTSQSLEVCSNPSSTTFQSGSGTTTDPYIICSADQLLLINTDTDHLSKSYKLGTDIDMSAVTTFSPIGTRDEASPSSAVPFTGNFDGDGHTIHGLTYQAANTTLSTGLFGYAKGSTITQLNMTGASMKGARHAALLVGYGENVNISHINLQGRLAPRDSEIDNIRSGGAVGILVINQANTVFVLDNINLNIELVANDASGALYGWITLLTNDTNLTISNITSTGTYTQPSAGNSMGSVGGYVDLNASNVNLSISNVHRTGDFSMAVGGGSWSGGLFGQFQIRGSSVQVIIDDCSMLGDFSARSTFNLAGSISGMIGNLSFTATNSTVTLSKLAVNGDVRILASSTTTNNTVGGLIGMLNAPGNTTSQVVIENSYFNGEIATENANTLNNVGGLIGDLAGNGTGSANVIVRTSYVNFTANIAATVVTNRLALIGRYANVVSSDFLDVYHQAPAAFIGAGGRAEPSNDTEVVGLNSAQILQSSSFVGTGWNFTTIWQANDGVASPVLR